jgi:hypothetical protein
VLFNDVAGTIHKDSYVGDGADNRSIATAGFQPDYVTVRADDTGTVRYGQHRPASLPGGFSMHYALANIGDGIQALQANGFEVGTDPAVNASGPTYHYIAFKNSGGGCSFAGQTLSAAADSRLDEASATTNFGTDTIIRVRSQNSNRNRRAVARFALPALPSGCTVTGARLRMNASSSVAGRTIEAIRLASSWTESGITWANQPATTGAAVSSTSGAGWREWDVTSHVQAMYSGSNDGWLLRDSAESATTAAEQQYHSREDATNPPELVVTFG